jgi:hypothetical protein
MSPPYISCYELFPIILTCTRSKVQVYDFKFIFEVIFSIGLDWIHNDCNITKARFEASTLIVVTKEDLACILEILSQDDSSING